MAQRLKHPRTNSVIIDQFAKLFRSAIMHVYVPFFCNDTNTLTPNQQRCYAIRHI